MFCYVTKTTEGRTVCWLVTSDHHTEWQFRNGSQEAKKEGCKKGEIELPRTRPQCPISFSWDPPPLFYHFSIIAWDYEFIEGFSPLITLEYSRADHLWRHSLSHTHSLKSWLSLETPLSHTLKTWPSLEMPLTHTLTQDLTVSEDDLSLTHTCLRLDCLWRRPLSHTLTPDLTVSGDALSLTHSRGVRYTSQVDNENQLPPVHWWC